LVVQHAASKEAAVVPAVAPFLVKSLYLVGGQALLVWALHLVVSAVQQALAVHVLASL